jgi:hypothetical protein
MRRVRAPLSPAAPRTACPRRPAAAAGGGEEELAWLECGGEWPVTRRRPAAVAGSGGARPAVERVASRAVAAGIRGPRPARPHTGRVATTRPAAILQLPGTASNAPRGGRRRATRGPARSEMSCARAAQDDAVSVDVGTRVTEAFREARRPPRAAASGCCSRGRAPPRRRDEPAGPGGRCGGPPRCSLLVRRATSPGRRRLGRGSPDARHGGRSPPAATRLCRSTARR